MARQHFSAEDALGLLGSEEGRYPGGTTQCPSTRINFILTWYCPDIYPDFSFSSYLSEIGVFPSDRQVEG